MAYVKGQPFIPQFTDPATGLLMANGTIEFYLTGTSTPTPYYTDSTGTSGGTSLTLNSGGKPPTDIYFDTSIIYKILVKDASGDVLDTIEPYSVTSSGAGFVANVAAIQAANLTGVSAVQTRGYSTDNDGGQSLYYADTSDTTSTDDGFSVIVSSDGVRFKLLHDGIIHLAQTGIDATGATDANVDFNKPFRLLTNGGEIVGSPGAIYQIDPTVSIPSTATGGIDTERVHFRYSNTKLRLNGATVKAKTNSSGQYEVIFLGKLKDDQTDETADTIENVCLEGPGLIQGDQDTHTGSTGETGTCVYITNATNVAIREVKITKGWGDGINVQKGPGKNSYTAPQNVVIDHVECAANRRNNVSLHQYFGVSIVNSRFTGSTGTAPSAGINIEPDFSYESGAAGINLKTFSTRIVNNEIIANDGAGVEIVDTTGTGVIEDVLILGNTIKENGRGGTGFAYGGIRVVSIDGSRAVRIIGNEIDANYGFGIDIDGAGVYGANANRRFLIANNSIMGTLEGNKSSSNWGHGILLQNGTACVVITGNLIERNDYHGIYLKNGTYGVDEADISNNYIFANGRKTNNTYDGIHIETNCSRIHVHHNFIRKSIVGDTLTNFQRYGIYCTPGYCVIENNYVYNGGNTGNIYAPLAVQMPDEASRTTIVRNNYGHITETVFRTASFAVDATGNFSITAAHGLDTYGLGTAADNARIKCQCQISVVEETITGNPVVVGYISDIDATNITINYTVVTAGSASDTARFCVQVQTPNLSV